MFEQFMVDFTYMYVTTNTWVVWKAYDESWMTDNLRVAMIANYM